MGLHLRYTTAAAAGTALLGLAVYAVFKSGALRPVLVGTIRGGMKAAEWVGGKLDCAKKGMEEMVAEAKERPAKPAPKAAPKAAAKPAAKSTAKPAAKPTAKAASKAAPKAEAASPA